MKNVINFAAVLVLFPLSWGISLVHAQANTEKAATNNESTPDAPDAIQVPAGEKVVLFARGVGSQIYTCQEGKDHKLAWILNAPDAELKDRNDKVIGQHFAGHFVEVERRQRSDRQSHR